MNAKYLMILSLLCIGGWVHAEQGCPPGFTLNASGTPGGPMCVPIPVYGTTNNTTPLPASGPRWQLTWGAIAIDVTTGDIGAAVGYFSRGKAKREAIALCAAKGAKKCKVDLTYKNQCAVVAWPSISGGRVISFGGPTIEVASELALSTCATRGGGECQIVSSECTPPVMVQD